MNKTEDSFDVIVIGSGMGGMSAASLLSGDGFKTLVLEAALALGGCSSSYRRKGYTFETGATTLIGFDKYQPLRILERMLGISIPKVAIDPSMQILLDDKTITRYRSRDQWIEESVRHFGESEAQKKFWNLAFSVSDVVWKVSGKNHFFPPNKIVDWFQLLKNDPRDIWVLPYALQSVREVAVDCGISNRLFFRFLDEQLMISAQAEADQTPFLFGAPASTYTNSTNYSVPGGLVEMVNKLGEYVESRGGIIHRKEKVTRVNKENGKYTITTKKAGKYRQYRSRIVVSNLPIWNMSELTHGRMATYFENESKSYTKARGAFTMGISVTDQFKAGTPLHHQIHLKDEDKMEGLNSNSIFVSLSHPDDETRSPNGMRTLNISTHTDAEWWFQLNGQYNSVKEHVQQQIIRIMDRDLCGFSADDIDIAFSSTPVTWSNWVYRKKGRVGGIPQQMDRSLMDWTPSETPFSGLYLVGDTVFPGQGIPGVTLSGINVYYRIRRNFKPDQLF